VTGTCQRRGTPRTATTALTLPVHPAAPRPATGVRSPLLTIAAAAGVLLLAGALLLFAARRRPRHAARHRPRPKAAPRGYRILRISHFLHAVFERIASRRAGAP
jgi:hypothetical protein